MDKRTFKGRGPSIPDNVIHLIGLVYDGHGEWTAQEIMNEVHKKLRKENKQLRPGWPGLSAVQKELAKIRQKDSERPPEAKGLDEAWSVVTLSECELPCAAIPTVLKMAVHFQQQGRAMTIREARWAARLSSVENLRRLYNFILDYAQEEKVRELTGVSDGYSVALDRELYTSLTDKLPNEPVFGKDGRELPSESFGKIMKGLEQERQQNK
jgi:hypothetical protein